MSNESVVKAEVKRPRKLSWVGSSEDVLRCTNIETNNVMLLELSRITSAWSRALLIYGAKQKLADNDNTLSGAARDAAIEKLIRRMYTETEISVIRRESLKLADAVKSPALSVEEQASLQALLAKAGLKV